MFSLVPVTKEMFNKCLLNKSLGLGVKLLNWKLGVDDAGVEKGLNLSWLFRFAAWEDDDGIQ